MAGTFTADEAGTAEDNGAVTTGATRGEEYLLPRRGLGDPDVEDWGVHQEYRDQINGGMTPSNPVS